MKKNCIGYLRVFIRMAGDVKIKACVVIIKFWRTVAILIIWLFFTIVDSDGNNRLNNEGRCLNRFF